MQDWQVFLFLFSSEMYFGMLYEIFGGLLTSYMTARLTAYMTHSGFEGACGQCVSFGCLLPFTRKPPNLPN